MPKAYDITEHFYDVVVIGAIVLTLVSWIVGYSIRG